MVTNEKTKVMKYIILLLVILFTSCVEPRVGYNPEMGVVDTTKIVIPKQIDVDFSVIPLSVVVIDSCEYLYGPWGNASVLTHKGNCKNHK